MEVSLLKSMICAVIAIAVCLGVTQVNAAPIHDAAKRGDVAAVQHQLDSGVDVNVRGFRGNTALLYASYWDRIEVIELLLKVLGLI